MVIVPPALPSPPGWSHAVAAGGWVFGSGAIATDFSAGLATDVLANSRQPFLTSPMELQSRHILGTIAAILTEAKCDIRRDLIRLWQWIPATYPSHEEYRTSRSHWPCFPSGTPYARELQRFGVDSKRSSTGIGVRQLPIPGAMLSVDFVAVSPVEGLEKQVFNMPADLPQVKIGYSPVTQFGDWLFMAGYGATDFKGDWMSSIHMGERSMVAPEARVNPYIWLGSEIETQTDYTLRTMARMAEAAGSSLSRCVKADVTLTHPDDFEGMDRVWRKYFPDDPPARNVVTGAQLVVKGTRVEIAMLLLSGDARLDKYTVNANGLAPPIGHAPHAVRAGPFVFMSTVLPIDDRGQVPTDSARNPAAPYFDQTIAKQTRMIFAHIDGVCRAAGTGLANVCKIQAFLDDMSSMPEMLGVWREAFPSDPPALSAMAMGGGTPLMCPGAHLQFDAIAFIPGASFE